MDWWFSNFTTTADLWYALLIILAVIWSLVWKGIALWYSARRVHAGWFVAFLIFPTLGVLEIIYLLLFRRVAPRPQKAPPESEIIMRVNSKLRGDRVRKKLDETKQRAKRGQVD